MCIWTKKAPCSHQTQTFYLSGLRTFLWGSLSASRGSLFGQIPMNLVMDISSQTPNPPLWLQPFAGTALEEVPFSFLSTWFESLDYTIKQNLSDKHFHPRTMELCLERSSTRGGGLVKKSHPNCDSGSSLRVFSSFRDWSYYQVFYRKSIVPRHSSDECFLSSAYPNEPASRWQRDL